MQRSGASRRSFGGFVVDMEDSAFYIFSLVLCALCMVFGIPGNCLILRVYWDKRRKSSTHILILGLAWADLFSCVFLSLRIASYVTFIVGKKPGEVLTFLHFFLQTAVASSVTLTGVIAFDRYDCVCRSYRRLFSTKRAKIAFCCSVTYCAAINIPFIVSIYRNSDASTVALYSFQSLCYISALTMIVLCYSKVYKTIRRHVQVGVWASTSGDRTNPTLQYESASSPRPASPHRQGLEMISVSHSVANNPGVSSSSEPMAWKSPSKSDPELAVETHRKERSTDGRGTAQSSHLTNQAVTGNSRRNSRLDQRPGGTSSLQRKTTRMLLLTSVAFLIAWLPYWLWVVLSLLDTFSTLKVHKGVLLVLARIKPSIYINNAINPLLYGLANRRFRQDCKQVLKKMF
ncbi:tyramine receptor Ser-2-like [Patiria miniata]|uniref:G-protein coupled receptors family 1 profile domain-containing protein n=1 Tax=Patiria miniata TaxID=46514 RepID=A0A913ZRR6_PATMI|nr:tyramine receptor Ser-2-like [Patiria miniata]